MEAKERELDDEEQAFLHQTRDGQDGYSDYRSQRAAAWYLRLLLELAMAVTIVYLWFFQPSPPLGSTPLQRTPVPKFPRKLYTFRNDPRYVREDMFFNESATLHTLHNWIPFSSASRGYVVLKEDSKPYDLPNPYTVSIDRHNNGPGYMMSVFHQLHCLSYLAEHFQQGYDGIELEEEIAHHSAHCFNYIRQGIMCAGDTTLEGETKEGPGEGSVHECVDYDLMLDWANNHAAQKWREALLPGESIL